MICLMFDFGIALSPAGRSRLLHGRAAEALAWRRAAHYRLDIYSVMRVSSLCLISAGRLF